MASTIEEMRATVVNYKTKLEEAQKKLAEMELTAPDRLLSKSEMEAMVLAFETRKTYKSNWKKAIKNNLIENVTGILEECCHYFNDSDSGLDIKAVKAQTGELGSRKWQLFVLKVIHYLKLEGSFNRDERLWNFDTFEDTAGGEDEVTQNFAIKVLTLTGLSVMLSSVSLRVVTVFLLVGRERLITVSLSMVILETEL